MSTTKASPEAEWTQTVNVSPLESFVAEVFRRSTQGENGELTCCQIRHSKDGGLSWVELPWRANPFSPGRYLVNWWPPTDGVQLTLVDDQLEITYQDEDWAEVTCKARYNSRFRWWWVFVPRPLFVKRHRT